MWVFGYGSLCWLPNFNYSESEIGFVRGYCRRFWQGNSTHRGNEKQPARVATLSEEPGGITYGVCYKLDDADSIEYLNQREVVLGGYSTHMVTVYCRSHGGSSSSSSCSSLASSSSGSLSSSSFTTAIQALVFIATSSSIHWLGPAPLELMADQMLRSSGPAGTNVEYLLRLAEFMRRRVPEADDPHLQQLEHLVLAKIVSADLCLDSLMGAERGAAPRIVTADGVASAYTSTVYQLQYSKQPV